MTKTPPKRTRREPTELDKRIAEVRRTARVMDRLRVRADLAAAAHEAARAQYRDACNAVAQNGTAQKAAGIGGEA